MTRLLSKNLVKQMYIVPPEEDTRVIDSNERVERRLKELRSFSHYYAQSTL